MKKAEDYLKPYKKYLVEGIDGYKNISGDGMFIGDVENAIKQAQIDAIDATAKACEFNFVSGMRKLPIEMVVDELKKELE